MTQQLAITSLRERYTAESGRVHLTGIQALARLTMDLRRADQRAGRRTAAFVSGYEGSPLGGFDLEMQHNQALLHELDILLQPGLNEELAATAVQGTQLACLQPDKRVDGVMGLWYGKSPGVDRSADALRHNNLMGTHPEGGVLLLAGDDPTAKSSTAPGASENILADVGMPVLFPCRPPGRAGPGHARRWRCRAPAGCGLPSRSSPTSQTAPGASTSTRRGSRPSSRTSPSRSGPTGIPPPRTCCSPASASSSAAATGRGARSRCGMPSPTASTGSPAGAPTTGSASSPQAPPTSPCARRCAPSGWTRPRWSGWASGCCTCG